MRSERLLVTAFEASRFLEGSLSHELSEHITAIDPDASEDGAFLVVVADNAEGFKLLKASLPEYVEVTGCRVSIICKPNELAHRMH
jgi:hypothetical protein